MMITRIARIQVIVFLILSLAGVAFVGIRYVGIGDQLLGDHYTLYADLNTAGGIYSNAPVTYRGVPIGRISSVRLHGNLVRVSMRVNRSVPVPRDLTAVVAQRSAVGEQYLDLRPNSDAGPYLRNGDVIPAERNRHATADGDAACQPRGARRIGEQQRPQRAHRPARCRVRDRRDGAAPDPGLVERAARGRQPVPSADPGPDTTTRTSCSRPRSPRRARFASGPLRWRSSPASSAKPIRTSAGC